MILATPPTQRHVLLAFLPYAVITIVYLVGVLVPGSAIPDVTKPLLMPALAVALLLGSRWRPSITVLLTFLAIVFSWLGDISPLGDFPVGFLTGLGLFLVAHVFYLAIFLRRVRERRFPKWVFVYVLWWVILLVVLGPNLGALFFPVAIYGVLLASVAATATRSNWVVALGAALFFASDSLLAIDRFAPTVPLPLPDFLIMITYTVGQGLIVAGIMRHERASDTRA